MFAYCMNDPVNRIDTEGFYGIWNELAIEGDFGYIHSRVQAEIAIRSLGTICTEVTFPNKERADLVDRNTGEVWEIKHAGSDPLGRIVEAQDQASKYLYRKGKCKGESITTAGAPFRFTGTFIIVMGNVKYMVTYITPAPGAVLYSVKELNEKYANAYAPVYQYKKKEECVTAYAFNPGWFFTFSIVGGAGSGCVAGGFDRLYRALLLEE